MDSTENDSRFKSMLTKRSARGLSVLVLLALLPVVAFAFSRSLYAGAITATNVVLIFVSVYLLLSPTEAGQDRDGGDAAETTV